MCWRKSGKGKKWKEKYQKAVRSQKLSILPLLIFRFYSLTILEVSIIFFEYLRLAVAELQEKTYKKIPTTRAEWKLLWDCQLAMVCLSVECFEGCYNNWNKETPTEMLGSHAKWEVRGKAIPSSNLGISLSISASSCTYGEGLVTYSWLGVSQIPLKHIRTCSWSLNLQLRASMVNTSGHQGQTLKLFSPQVTKPSSCCQF